MEDCITDGLFVRPEFLLVLLFMGVSLTAWLLWELSWSFSRWGNLEAEVTASTNWWQALKNCSHRRLIIPPHCVTEVVDQNTVMNRWSRSASDAVKKVRGVVSSGLQRTGDLISRSGSIKLSKKRNKSRQQLNEADQPVAGKLKKRSSKANLQVEGTFGSPANSPAHRLGDVVEGGTEGSGVATVNCKPRKTSRTAEFGLEGITPRSKSGSRNDITHFGNGDGLSPSEPPQVIMKHSSTLTASTSTQSSPSTAPSPSKPLVPEGRTLIFHDLPEDCTPLLAFVNSRSGLSQGAHLIHQLRALLNPIQVVDLADEDPVKALRKFLDLPKLRILVCGGDGTAKWIMACLDQLEVDNWPPIGILPLGTGNDLARVLGWGGGYSNEGIVDFLSQVQLAHVMLLDRWELRITPQNKKQSKLLDFNNYFGIGVDAQAALKFHHLRESKPQLFFSRVVNKMWYAMLGAQDLFRRTCQNLPNHLKLVADGKEIELPPSVQGVIFLNIQSYGGGVKLWSGEGDEGNEYTDSDGDKSPITADPVFLSPSGIASMQDGMLEVVAVTGIVHLGQLQVGLSRAIKICQCREVVITTFKDLPMQADGEPWGQPKGVIRITAKKEPAYMLHRTLDAGGVVIQEMIELLDWANASGVINVPQRKSLLTEFSRRVEAKRRQYEEMERVESAGVLKALEGKGRPGAETSRQCIIS